jgi:myo-inositol catabolism protein IolS
MQYRRLGATGLQVSALGFGGAALSGANGGYGFGDIDEAEAIALCHHALEAGVTLFDTAPVYGFGASERRLGKAFRDRRDQVILVSKSGITWDDAGRLVETNDPGVTQRMLEQSLRDLQTDYLDVYLVHWPDANVDIREPVAVLQRAKEAGKIRHLGLSNSYPEDLARASEVGEIEVLQNAFHLFQDYPRQALFPLVHERDLGFMGYGTFDKGILTGHVTESRRYDESDVRSWAPWFKSERREPKYAALRRLEPLLAETGHSALELALGWVLHHDEVSTALCGFRRAAQLDSAIAALAHLPQPNLLATAKAIAQEHVG